MTQSTSRLANEIAGRPYFAEITLALEKGPCSGLVVEFGDACATEWRGAAHFGIEYAWNRMAGPFKVVGMCVKVLSIHTFPTDSTPVMVAYVAANATWELAGTEPDSRPLLDESREGFFFPR